MQNIAELNLKSLFRILIKRKIAFLIAFIVVLTAGLTFTFLVSPEYSLTSQITLSDNEIFYNDDLYKYFPEEADNLWIIPSMEESIQKVDYIIGKLDPIDTELRSDMIVNNVLSALDYEITEVQLIKSVNISVDRWVGKVAIESYARTPDLAYDINKSILDSYISQKEIELEDAYDILLEKLGPEIELSEKEISSLEDEIEEETSDLALSKELDMAYEKYDVLNTTRQNMIGYKDLFISRINILKSPELVDVKNTSSYLRNILLSLIVAIVIGIITAFAVNYFKSPRN